MMDGRDRRKRMKKKLASLMAVIVLVLTASSAALADGQIRILPVDLSGGAPYKTTFRDNPNVIVDPAFRDDLFKSDFKKYPYSQYMSFYEDPTIRVDMYTSRITNSEEYGMVYCFYAFVTIQSPYQLRTAAVDPVNFIRGLEAPGTEIVKRVNAVLAVNGDFCNTHTKGEGSKYCLRQGTVFRDTVVDFLDMLLIDEDGNFHVYQAGPELATLNKTEIDGKKVINALQFGPALVIDGKNVPEEYILDRSHSPWSAEPDNHTARMCIGQIDELSYIVFTCWDGMNLKQLRDLVLSITPVKTLYVLDGGNSAQMIFLKSQINRDDNANGNGRAIQDIIYFASAYFEDKE